MATYTLPTSSRFIPLAKKMWIENRKTILMQCGGYLGAWILLGAWSGYLGATPSLTAMVIYTVFANLACMIVASKMFFDMTRKERRISMLMTPASGADKFIVRLLAVLPGMIAIAFIGYLVFTHSMRLYPGIAEGIWYPVFNPLQHITENGGLMVTSIFAWFLFYDAVFIFGAIAWPKKSFLKTSGLIIACYIALSVISVILASINWSFSIIIEDNAALLWILCGISFTVSLLIIWAAYRRMKKVTVLI